MSIIHHVTHLGITASVTHGPHFQRLTTNVNYKYKELKKKKKLKILWSQ